MIQMVLPGGGVDDDIIEVGSGIGLSHSISHSPKGSTQHCQCPEAVPNVVFGHKEGAGGHARNVWVHLCHLCLNSLAAYFRDSV